MYFGGGRLEDLLPDIALPEDKKEQADETQDDGAHAHGIAAGSRGFGSSGFGSGLASLPSSQWPLLEETEGHEATQLQQERGRAAEGLTQASRKVLR
jgi:hypothetical protein